MHTFLARIGLTISMLAALILSSVALAEESNNVIWIDVRTAEEFNSGHLSQAHHIPFQDIRERIAEVTQDKNATIKLYCRSGRRASWAKDDLEAAGFKHVINEGGYEDLKHLSK